MSIFQFLRRAGHDAETGKENPDQRTTTARPVKCILGICIHGRDQSLKLNVDSAGAESLSDSFILIIETEVTFSKTLLRSKHNLRFEIF